MISDTSNDEYQNIIKQQNKIFNSVDKNHQIEVSVVGNTCWFNINKFEFEYYKTFLLMLKDVLVFLKNNNVIYIKQYIYEDDCEYFKNSSVVNIYKDKYIVTTNIDNFIDEIISVFGINKI